MNTVSTIVPPGSFDSPSHFYPRVLNAQIHSLIKHLLELGNERIVTRYCHLHPEVDEDAIRGLLSTPTRYFRWGGSDLIHVTTEAGIRQVVIVETNSCPSGQKSMPRLYEAQEESGYLTVLRDSFLYALQRRKSLPKGGLAVIYDKNHMENSGYAASLASLLDENVHLVPYFQHDTDPPARFTSERVLEIRQDDEWVPIRAAFRYVTQRPWNRIPPLAKSMIFNPVVVCLAGGRNKLVAAKAYDLFNAKHLTSGLRINTPETIWDVSKQEVPLWVERMGGIAVVKVPYSNAGQGVYTIANAAELEAFMALDHGYDNFIVQALIGNAKWSSRSQLGRLFHVGTMPDKRMNLYVADLRFMVLAGEKGFQPVALYARRARTPLVRELPQDIPSWDILGTNLSARLDDGSWTTESERLLLVDGRDFNRLGLGLDDLIDSYVQTVMSVKAIDDMAQALVNSKGVFRRKFFLSINRDARLAAEIMH